MRKEDYPQANTENKQSEVQNDRNGRLVDGNGRRPVMGREEAAQMVQEAGRDNSARAPVQYPQQYERNIQDNRNNGGYGRAQGQHRSSGNHFAPYPRGNQFAAGDLRRPVNGDGWNAGPLGGDPNMTVNEVLQQCAPLGNYNQADVKISNGMDRQLVDFLGTWKSPDASARYFRANPRAVLLLVRKFYLSTGPTAEQRNGRNAERPQRVYRGSSNAIPPVRVQDDS